ncbi:MAG: DUF1842 domain-containing protein [Ignavibacteria bacterium]|jgi:hypothetical protein
MADTKTGLFPVCYRIGGNMPGAPTFNVHLMVYTPDKRVNGFGEITQAISPPLEVPTHILGSYTYMTVMPDITHILVTATGYPPIQWPPHGGIGPAIPSNVELRMVLSNDWSTGTAQYKYFANGSWHETPDAPVERLEC